MCTYYANQVLDLVLSAARPQYLVSNPVLEEELPDWTQEHYTPIAVTGRRVTLCKLKFEDYYHSPHVYPMFKDLVAASHCNLLGNSKIDTLDNILAALQARNGTVGGRVVPPSGFVFHESRVGSTLVANMLASNPWNMVSISCGSQS